MKETRISPEDYLDSVFDEKTFLEFLLILSEDWEKHAAIEETTPSLPYGTGALGWENGTIGAFLCFAILYHFEVELDVSYLILSSLFITGLGTYSTNKLIPS